MKKLTKAEEQVMQALWKIQEGVLKDIVNAMQKPKPAYNTISTIVRILVNKEFVTYKTYGKTNLYRPTIEKERYSSSEVNGIIQKYFNNSPKNLLSFLVKDKSIDVAELEEILKELEK